jgi:adenylosuccinate synthase
MTFDVVGRNLVEPAVDYLLDVAYDEYPNETSWSLTTGAVVAASGFDEVTASGFFLVGVCRLGSWRRVPAGDP